MSTKPLTPEDERRLRDRANGYWPSREEWALVWATLDAARERAKELERALSDVCGVIIPSNVERKMALSDWHLRMTQDEADHIRTAVLKWQP
jgi:hypothetical protein